MIGIIDTLKKVFTGTDLLFKHTLLFVFTGVIALISLPMHEMSSLENLTNAQLLTVLGMFFVTAIVSIYTAGYNYRFTHKSYDKDCNDLLPQWDFSLFKDGFKVLALGLVYCLYALIFYVLGGLLGGFLLGLLNTLLKLPQNIHNICLIVILSLIFLVLIVYLFYMPFAIVDSAKERKVKGFFNPLKPLGYIKPTIVPYLILLLKWAPAYIVIYLVQVYCYYLPNVLTYIITAVCAYLIAVYGLVLYYQIRQIIESKYYNLQNKIEE